MRTKLKVHQLGMQSNGVVAGEGANCTVILFQSTCDFHHKFGDLSFILLTLLIVSFTCSLIRVQLVSQLIHVQLVSLDFGPQGVINKIYNLLHHVLG